MPSTTALHAAVFGASGKTRRRVFKHPLTGARFNDSISKIVQRPDEAERINKPDPCTRFPVDDVLYWHPCLKYIILAWEAPSTYLHIKKQALGMERGSGIRRLHTLQFREVSHRMWRKYVTSSIQAGQQQALCPLNDSQSDDTNVCTVGQVENAKRKWGRVKNVQCARVRV